VCTKFSYRVGIKFYLKWFISSLDHETVDSPFILILITLSFCASYVNFPRCLTLFFRQIKNEFSQSCKSGQALRAGFGPKFYDTFGPNLNSF